jgi:flagellar biosynthesis anti-sigma factor FlgM
VEAAPDVRAEKVARIKQQVESGTYSVPAEELAKKLLGGGQP